MASFVKLSVQEIFDNIQYFRNSDGSICGSTQVGFGAEQKANSSKEASFSSLMDLCLENYVKSFSKSSTKDETVDAQAKYIINSLDKDKNGAISTNEVNDFKNSKMNSNLDKQISKLENQFQMYDINQDGELDLTELKKALCQKRYSVQELGKMAKEFHDNKLISNEDKPLLNASDFI